MNRGQGRVMLAAAGAGLLRLSRLVMKD
jgi:hypothetical protein